MDSQKNPLVRLNEGIRVRQRAQLFGSGRLLTAHHPWA